MKKILLILTILSLGTPFAVFADDGPGPTSCLYNPDDASKETCKVISISNIISLDTSLQNDYFLGQHSRVEISRFNDNPYIPGQQTEFSKYSEQIYSINKQTQDISGDDVTILSEPEDFRGFVVLDKEYFLSRLAEAFRVGGLSFSENNIPERLNIYVLNTKELLFNHRDIEFYFKSHFGLTSVPKMNSVIFNKDSYNTHTIFSIDDKDYGKHIYATKGGILESQYIDVDKGSILTATDLQVTNVSAKHGEPSVVPLTSPLKSVKNYWIFTKKNGKITLVWQKSEYTLDNGKVKVVNKADKNVSAALLFADTKDAPTQTLSAASTVAPVVGSEDKKVGFFARFINMVLFWFK